MASFSVPCPKVSPLLAASSQSTQRRQCIASFPRFDSRSNPALTTMAQSQVHLLLCSFSLNVISKCENCLLIVFIWFCKLSIQWASWKEYSNFKGIADVEYGFCLQVLNFDALLNWWTVIVVSVYNYSYLPKDLDIRKHCVIVFGGWMSVLNAFRLKVELRVIKSF